MHITPAHVMLIGFTSLLAAGCSQINSKDSASDTTPQEQAAPATEQVIGSISYRERIALPPGSVAHIKLSDVSRADAPSILLAEQNTTMFAKQVPVPFTLKVEPAMFDLRNSYSVSAQIRSAEGQLLWTTDSANLIDVTQPVADMGTLMLIKVSGAVADDAEIVDVNAFLPFAAQGNEPGWTLKVDNERMSLNRQNDPTTILTPTPTTTREDASYHFNASTEANSVIVDVTPDRSAILGKTPVQGLYVNCGWGTGGFKATPGAAHTLAWTVAKDEPHPINAPFTLERFQTGRLIDEAAAAAVAH